VETAQTSCQHGCVLSQRTLFYSFPSVVNLVGRTHTGRVIRYWLWGIL